MNSERGDDGGCGCFFALIGLAILIFVLAGVGCFGPDNAEFAKELF